MRCRHFQSRMAREDGSKQTDEQNLWERLVNLESSVLMFARVKEVDATNNRAERDLLDRISLIRKSLDVFGHQILQVIFADFSATPKQCVTGRYSSLNAISLALNVNIPTR